MQAWFKTMEKETFADFNDLRATFASADYVDGLTVFNIGGNKYRLIASVHCNRKKVFITNAGCATVLFAGPPVRLGVSLQDGLHPGDVALALGAEELDHLRLQPRMH